jgi:hypothetical protein
MKIYRTILRTLLILFTPLISFLTFENLKISANYWSSSFTNPLVEMLPNNSYPIKVNFGEQAHILKFTPDFSGYYIFESTSISGTSQYQDTIAYLYSYNPNQGYIAFDDDSGNGTHFRITYFLFAELSYYLKVKYLSPSKIGSFYVIVT